LKTAVGEATRSRNASAYAPYRDDDDPASHDDHAEAERWEREEQQVSGKTLDVA
jgi:hypothetical protein